MEKIKKAVLMDAGTVLFQSSGGFGPNLGQLEKELKELGRVTWIPDVPEAALPKPMRGFDFLLDRSNFLRTNYLALRLSDAGPAGTTDSEGREVRRYAIELVATPTGNIDKAIEKLRNKYKVI